MTYYSTKEVSEILGIHINTVMNWIKDKRIVAYKIGGVWRINESDLKTFIESQKN